MTSDFVKQIHLQTARRYYQQGHDVSFVVSHFEKVALDQEEIQELLSQLEPAYYQPQSDRAR